MKKLVVLALAALLAACAPKAPANQVISAPGGTYTNVSAPTLRDMLRNKDFVFVNVHIPFAGDIAGTDLSIPYDQIEQNLSQLPDKHARIMLYCRSGRMSTMAAETLVKLGYTNVWTLEGGMQAWQAAGFPLAVK
ncbi:MAG: rhodanese-like domain-containing protein [Anaerolineae bacterium]